LLSCPNNICITFLLYHDHYIISFGALACSLVLFVGVEFCWNVYPSNNYSSALLLCLHLLILWGLWSAQSEYPYVEEKLSTRKKEKWVSKVFFCFVSEEFSLSPDVILELKIKYGKATWMQNRENNRVAPSSALLFIFIFV
jgi:hypothetical protein